MSIRTRQDKIVRLLTRSFSSTVSDLAAEVKASRRTVLRDLGALRDQGFVIHSECGRGGGVQLDPRSVQSASLLSVVEVFALLISVGTMRMVGSFPFAALADAGLGKIEKALPPEKVKDLRSLLDCLHVGKLSPEQDLADLGEMDADLLPAFETAFLQKRMLHFSYRDARGVRTDRIVEPQAILILPPLWYLVAWDPLRSDFRHFRMDRIIAPEVATDMFLRRRRVPFDEDVCPFSELADQTRSKIERDKSRQKGHE